MADFLILHSADTDDLVAVNLDTVEKIEPHPKGGTQLFFSTDYDVRVHENFEQVTTEIGATVLSTFD